jgi:GT2 family glycosyltransferase
VAEALTIAIPTYNRGAILLETLQRLFALELPANEIVVVDQTAEPLAQLLRWNEDGRIRYVRLSKPSIPHAMNVALQTATSPLVLFLDDDVEPSPRLVAEHLAAHRGDGIIWAVAGQVLQPGEEPEPLPHPGDDLAFPFRSSEPAFVANVMAGNLSVRRDRAIAIGGFDENYVGAAYRFETDFARRLVAAGGKIRFEPRASLRHLKLSTGGLRTFGDHKTSISPMHAVGDYYFALAHVDRFAPYALHRLRANVVTRFHARHPWTIPGKLIGELRAMLLARRLHRRGPLLLPEVNKPR